MRQLFPPGALNARRESAWRSRITLEAQNTAPSELGKNFMNFRMVADPAKAEQVKPLFAPGNGKPAGSKRVLRPYRGKVRDV
jgi:hypothetical protein